MLFMLRRWMVDWQCHQKRNLQYDFWCPLVSLGPFIFSRATPKVATTHNMIGSDHGGTPSSLVPFQNRPQFIWHHFCLLMRACNVFVMLFKSPGEKGHCHPGKHHSNQDRNSSWSESIALYNSAEPKERFLPMGKNVFYYTEFPCTYHSKIIKLHYFEKKAEILL